jgi:hypothetical protein
LMSWSVVMMEEPVIEVSGLNRIWHCVGWVVLTVLKGASWAIHSVTQHHIVSPKKHHNENLKSWTNNCWARVHTSFPHMSSWFLYSKHYWLFGIMWTNMVLYCCNLLIRSAHIRMATFFCIFHFLSTPCELFISLKNAWFLHSFCAIH